MADEGGMKKLPPPPRLTVWVPAMVALGLSALYLLLLGLV